MYISRFLTALLLGSCLMLGAASVVAQSAPAPTVTTRQEGGDTIREYRINGHLYAIEIRTASGQAYHLMDHDGNGNFARESGTDIRAPGWVLPPR
ncbi:MULTISPECIES: DUF2782 domain-containing protein [Halomonadaceae]|uniref:DUF2782 domain-containing protein n=1 Tax=Halomonadaceae TaxID=28256 RepID=UPI0015987060|nr:MULTISPECIES: DUF2782 domain-containing protein [Halomonas]QJQ94984.1 DUF2782 domain-containing protein [Halomonas sp. PA5]